MPDIAAVLLVPEEGDPRGLLAEGPCGARPPTVRLLGGGVGWTTGASDGVRWPVLRRAIVLAWQGQAVMEGLLRLHENDVNGARMGLWYVQVKDALAGSCRHLRGLCDGLGTLVLLDADGREVTP